MRFLLLAFAVTIPLAAQPKPPITPADYAKWETLGSGVFSPDGKWLAYTIRRSDGTYELRVSPVAGGKTLIAKLATDPAFSSDSRWVAYAIGVSESDAEKAPAARKPQNRLGLMDLSTGTATTVDDITAFAFSDRGAFLAMRRYGARPAGAAAATPAAGRGGRGGGGRGGGADAVGTTLLVRDLATGVDTTFGDVTDFKWQDKGTHLAMIIGAENRVGNGVQLFDAAASTLKVLDSGNASFSNLTWRKDSSDLAALRSKRDRAYDGDSHIVLAWQNVAAKKTADVPAPQRIVSSRAPQWSEDGKIIYIGIAEWEKKADQVPGDPANVEVWHSKDVNVIAEQKLRLARDRDRHVVAAWHLDSGKVVPLGTNVKETMTIPRHGSIALAMDETPYDTDGMFGRRYNDVYKVDLMSGTRTAVAKRVIPPVWHSPGGHYVLAFKDNVYTIYDLETGATRDISKAVAGVTFTDKEDDHTPAHKPSWGIAGWTKDDKSVIVYDDTDVYELYSDGSKARKLTNGSAEQVRYRYVNVQSGGGGGRGGRGGFGGGNDEAIDLSKPVYLSLYGIWTKKTGYAILKGDSVEKAVWLDRGTRGLIKAKEAETYAYVAEAFDVSPNYFAAQADLKSPRQVSDTNPFQSNYAWGKSQLIEYKSPQGERLQGALFYPANYEPGKKYPMLVHIYERESNFLHRYFPVSERSPYSEAIWTSKGYFVLMPDIVFRPRDPGMSILECTVAATKAAIATGMIDSKHMGITGHSWGGYGSTFIMTQTDMFAAGAVGGSLTDLISNFGEVYWNNGVPETGHMEVGQERMQVPLWEDPQAYIRNSSVFSINKMKGPLLMSTADHDGASDWHQTLEFYNIARRAGKQVVMLMYPGENHSLAIKANQIDYHHRILDWFGYYLKGNDAPEWINKGTSVLDRERELKRIKKETEPATETGRGPGAP